MNHSHIASLRSVTIMIAISLPAILTERAVAQTPKDDYDAKRARIKVEEELRVALRTIRQAIDQYKIACEMGNIGPRDRKIEDECLSPTLQALVTGIHPPNRPETIMRFLRRIPVDPTTGRRSWGLRSIQDDPNSRSAWGGQNVFDVYSKSRARALDGSRYRDW